MIQIAFAICDMCDIEVKIIHSGRLKYNLTREPASKCFSLVKVKESENFNHRNTLSILRIKI